jgi:hypothetical protein
MAKLKWPVSIDGKQIESETYKILGILDKSQRPSWVVIAQIQAQFSQANLRRIGFI